MHAASRWLLTLIGMLLLVLPCAGPPLHAAAQSRSTSKASQSAQTPTAQRPPSRTVDPLIRIPQQPSPAPGIKQQIAPCIVPALSDIRDARRDLAGRNLTLGSVHRVETDRRRGGTVIDQSPKPASRVRCGSDVDVWIAVPSPVPPKPDPQIVDCRVPDLLEDRETDVEPQLARAKLRVGRINGQESDRREGTVVAQSPSRGVEVKCGSRVDVWIALPPQPKPAPPKPDPPKPDPPKPDPPKPDTSRPDPTKPDAPRPEPPKPELPTPEPPKPDPPKPDPPRPAPVTIVVPRLEGRDEAAATRMLEAVGLRVGEIRFRESIEPRGIVIDQAPQAGRRVDADSAVDLWMATPRRTLVPDVRGRSQRAAGDALRQAGLVAGDVRERQSQALLGTVIDQQPAPGVQVDAGTGVSLSIASPVVAAPPPPPPPPLVQPPRPAPVRVPAVVGMPLERAFVLLQNAGLRPGRISEIRAVTTAGTVSTQFPAAGTDVSSGAQVDLIVALSVGVAPWFMSPWALAWLGLGLMVAIAGLLRKMRTKTKTGRESTPPSVSFAPHADPGMQSAVSESGVVTRSEFRLESFPDKGLQELHWSDRLAGET